MTLDRMERTFFFKNEQWELPSTALKKKVNACINTGKVNTSFTMLCFIISGGQNHGQLCKNPNALST